ncbi:MAG: hypothetical protein JRF36_00835 [Deltaproteobacteria bacterium]|jgi:hypothetical protein|nr:hypothetical protein [Deltaproteobacteria bacterium]
MSKLEQALNSFFKKSVFCLTGNLVAKKMGRLTHQFFLGKPKNWERPKIQATADQRGGYAE